MKKIVYLLLLCLLMTSCAARKSGEPSLEQQDASVTSGQEDSTEADMTGDSQSVIEANPPKEALDDERLNEIMCIFGAERKIQYNSQGEPEETENEEYQTSVISFYYHEDGISSANDITPYGFYGWYLAYTLLQDEKIAEVLPGFERMAIIRNDPVSGEIYGAPGDDYEAIVTSFFDVDVQQLRGDDLYDEKAHAYIPITGPGIGERPTVRIAAMERHDDLIVLDISVEGYNPIMYKLTVREDKSNEFAGIKFISLHQESDDGLE